MPCKITKVYKESFAEYLGIVAGDILISINKKQINDFLDLTFWISDFIGFLIWESNGKKKKVLLDEFEPISLGIEIENFKLKKCNNNCIFCFVNQNVKNLRKTLYIKDDDYRTSFLNGAYITLTNLKTKEINKIKKMKISPLYISVHSTDPEIRAKLLGRTSTTPILNLLNDLKNSNIELHCQIVIVPGINDGKELEKTIVDLIKVQVSSLSIVPVGLTKHRKNLYRINQVSKDNAREIIELAKFYQKYLKKIYNKNIIYPTDNMFLLADLEIPSAEFYDDFCQLENGVGSIRLFVDEIEKVEKFVNKKKIFLVTGEAMYKYIYLFADLFNSKREKNTEVIKIKNEFLGKSVKTAGLLAGNDIKKNIKGLDGLIFIPERSLNYNKKFIDNLDLKYLKKSFNIKIAPESPKKLWKIIKKINIK